MHIYCQFPTPSDTIRQQVRQQQTLAVTASDTIRQQNARTYMCRRAHTYAHADTHILLSDASDGVGNKNKPLI